MGTDLSTSSAGGIRRLFGAVARWGAIESGAQHTFPNLHQKVAEDGRRVFGTQLLTRSKHISFRDLPAWQVGGDSDRDSADGIVGRFTRTHDYATSTGFVGGIPTLHQVEDGIGRLCGTILIRSDVAEWRDVPAEELAGPDRVFSRRNSVRGISQRFTTAFDYAIRSGFAGGYPTLHETRKSGTTMMGVVLLRHGAVAHSDALAAELEILYHMAGYKFTGGFTPDDRFAIIREHYRSWQRFGSCGLLSDDVQAALGKTYRRTIVHHATSRHRIFGFVLSGRDSEMWLNVGALRAIGDDELRRTLIHEMTHLAGYSHPQRRDCGPTVSPPDCDVPGDGGPYFGTPPLQAEICATGIQTDGAAPSPVQVERRCEVDDSGACVIVH